MVPPPAGLGQASEEPALARGVGPDDLPRSLPTLSVL